jgi:capsular polysaccharide transport system permease protein
VIDSQKPARKPVWQRINKLFLLFVAIPTLASSAYFGLIASDIYVSQSKFVIYNPQLPSAGSGLGGLLQGVGLGNNSTYAANAVHDYLLSRDALLQLQKTLHYRKLFQTRSIDPFNRFGGWLWFDTRFEQLYRYYIHMVGDDVDPATNISTLNVDAYTARDAQRINQALLLQAQQLVDRMNSGANEDAVKFYQQRVNSAEIKVQAAAVALATYRNQSKIFNPAPQADLQEQLIAKLQTQQLATQLQLAQLEVNAPKNPSILLLKRNIADLQRQIEQMSTKIVGSNTSLASKSTTFERLSLSQNFAQRELAANLNALEQARVQAQKQQLFIETIVTPNLPDEALLPRRWRNVLATVLLGLLLWGVFSVVIGGIREHHEP